MISQRRVCTDIVLLPAASMKVRLLIIIHCSCLVACSEWVLHQVSEGTSLRTIYGHRKFCKSSASHLQTPVNTRCMQVASKKKDICGHLHAG